MAEHVYTKKKNHNIVLQYEEKDYFYIQAMSWYSPSKWNVNEEEAGQLQDLLKRWKNEDAGLLLH